MKRQSESKRSKRKAPEAGIGDRAPEIFESATQLVALTDKGGVLSYINPAGRALLGLSIRTNLSGLALIECVAPSARTRFSKVVVPIALNNGHWRGDCALLTRDGRQLDVALQVSAHRDERGQFDGLSLVAQDLSAWNGTSAALSTARSELLLLSAQHLTIQENERRRIAADLHDGLGQSLGILSASIESAVNLVNEGEKEQSLECLDRLRRNVRSALDDLRRIAMDLRPAMLDSLGILATLSWHSREIEAAYPSVQFERKIGVSEDDVPQSLRTAMFRIVQEAGNNAIQHGKANHLVVRLNKKYGVLELTIEDNGKGFDPGVISKSRPLDRGLGLQSMRERAELSCGIFDITSEPGKGTRVRVRWAVSLREIGLDCAAALGKETQAAVNEDGNSPKGFQDFEMSLNNSICADCIRKAKSHG